MLTDSKERYEYVRWWKDALKAQGAESLGWLFEQNARLAAGYRAMNDENLAIHADLAEASFSTLSGG